MELILKSKADVDKVYTTKVRTLLSYALGEFKKLNPRRKKLVVELDLVTPLLYVVEVHEKVNSASVMLTVLDDVAHNGGLDGAIIALKNSGFCNQYDETAFQGVTFLSEEFEAACQELVDIYNGSTPEEGCHCDEECETCACKIK